MYLSVLAQVELLAETTSRRDKLYVLGLWVLSTALAGATLELSPHTVLDFRWEAAAQELSALVTQVARRVHSAPQVPSISVWQQSLTRMHCAQGAPHACSNQVSNCSDLRKEVDDFLYPSCMLSATKAAACDIHCSRSQLNLWQHSLRLCAHGGCVR